MEILRQKKQTLKLDKGKDSKGIKVTNITFLKDQFAIENQLLLNLKGNKSTNHKNISKDKDRSQQYHLGHHKNHKCSHQTKISQMFFVKSINLSNKPKLSKDKENHFRVSDIKITKSTIIQERQKKLLNPILRPNYLKRSSCVLQLHQNQGQSQQKQRNINQSIKNKQIENTIHNSIKLQNYSCKDPIFENKLYKYWKELQKVAELHKIQLVQMDYRGPLKFYVGKGNNSRLVKEVMKKRWWWTNVQDRTYNDINLIWMQLKDKLFYQIRKSTSKSNDSMTTTTTNSQNQISLATKKEKYKSQRSLQTNVQSVERSHSQSQLLQPVYYQSSLKNFKAKLCRLQTTIHNHFQHNQFLGNKKALYYNMKNYYNNKNQNVFTYLPVTFNVTSTSDQQFISFSKLYQSQYKKNKRKKLWIIKPGQNSNRGKGITIHSELHQIKNLIESIFQQQQLKQIKYDNSKNLSKHKRTFIIQQYIEKPFLYNRRKFDIRCYIMLCSLNNSIKGYWYRDGYIRTSCYQFTLDSFNNSFVHLTNDAIQKNCQQYGKYELGNKLSFQTFKRYLNFKYPKKYDFNEQVYEKIRKIAIDSMKASYQMLTGKNSYTVFEIFGLDFMIDQNFQPWLIQINTNPCLETTCPVLQKIIPKMLDDAFKLSVDAVFPPPQTWPVSKRHLIGCSGSNNFQFVFEEPAQAQQSQCMQKYEVQKIGQIEQDDQIYQQE